MVRREKAEVRQVAATAPEGRHVGDRVAGGLLLYTVFALAGCGGGSTLDLPPAEGEPVEGDTVIEEPREPGDSGAFPGLSRLEAKQDRLLQSIAAPDTRALLDRAATALREGNDDVGYAFLAAAAGGAPGDSAVLDLLHSRAAESVDGIETDGGAGTDEAATRLGVLGEAIRAGFVAARSPEEVERLLEREAEAAALADRLAAVRPKTLESEPVADRLVEVRRLADDATGETDLRIVILRAERLRDDAVARMLDDPGGQADRNLSETETLLSDLGTRLEKLSISALRAEADSQTERVLADVRGILDGVSKGREAKLNDGVAEPSWQSLGDRLVEAELLAGGVHPLSSESLRREAQETLSRLRKEAVAVRAGQQSAYNDWAVDRIKEAIEDYNAGVGLFNDDEGRFASALGNRLGPIEPRHLHPAVSTLYGEIYQKLISELDEKQKVRATEAVERKAKRALEEF